MSSYLSGLALLTAVMSPAAWAAAPPTIPLVVGLTTTTAVSEAQRGDYESLATISEVSADSYSIAVSAEVPDDDGVVGELKLSRRILMEDLRTARILRERFTTADAPVFPGTVPSFSTIIVNDLRSTGRAAITVLQSELRYGLHFIKARYSGYLSRVGSGPVDVPMLVNGRKTTLKALHVAGRLSAGKDSAEFDYLILDEPGNPIRLRSKAPWYSSEIVKIDFPESPQVSDSLERSLAEQRRAVIYGIYFSFNRADIRAASARVLTQIADVMKKNPDWKLRIEGHTDNIGGDAANLELSKRRAESVKTALVSQYGIAANRLSSNGFGASQPQEKNDTPEGRARNRRVVLTRE